MFKAIFFTWYCLVSLNLSGLTDGKPIAGFQPSEHPQGTTILIPRAVISGEELVALAQYVMRTMASRVNITLQAATSHTNFPRYADNIPFNFGIVRSTTPAAMASKDYETFGNTRQTEYESTRCADQKLKYPCRTVAGTEKSPTYEPFVKYAERDVESFPNQFGVEIIPTSEIPTTYLPQVEKNTGVLPLMEQVVNSTPTPPGTTTMPTVEEKDPRSSDKPMINSTVEQAPPSQPGNRVVSVPFEAVITFSGPKSPSPKIEAGDQTVVTPSRNPPDEFPPYFETVVSLRNKTQDPESGSPDSNPGTNLNPPGDAVVELMPEFFNPMKKRRTPKAGELLEKFTANRLKASRKRGAKGPTTSSPFVSPSRSMRAPNFPRATMEEKTTTPPKGGPMFQRQEIEEDEDEEEGSLGSVTDLLPLVIPILEDLSDPNTETDIAEILEAGLPLIQGISQGDGENEGVDVVQLVSPILASLSAPNRNGTGTVFQAILPLVLPLVTPFIGPILGPIIQGSATPADQGGSSITPLIQAVAGPLSLPTQPGGISIASSLISGIVASLSKDLKNGGDGGSDISALVSTIVSGVVAGGSVGIKAKLMKPPPPTYPGYATYGQGPVPASSVDPLDLVGTSVKEILGLTLQLVKSVVTSVTGILGASSAKQPRPVYGPPGANSRVT